MMRVSSDDTMSQEQAKEGREGFTHVKRTCAKKTLAGSSKDEAHPLARAHGWFTTEQTDNTRNDPSAGSPTETLLRLLLPLSGKVHKTSRDCIQELNALQSE